MPVIKVKSEEVKIKVPLTTMRIEPTTQTKTVEPTIEEQLITPDEGVFALSSVTINPVTSEIDKNITSSNIKEGIEILGVIGSMKEYKETIFQNKTVTPTTSLQNIVADNGYDALSEVTINAVTSEIDENIKAENIKEGISILGVEGELVEAVGGSVDIRDYFNETIPAGTGNATEKVGWVKMIKKLPDVKPAANSCKYMFALFPYDEKMLPNIDTSNVTIMDYMFANTNLLTTIPSLNTDSVTSMLAMLSGAKALIEVPLLNTQNVTTMQQMFYSCSNLTKLPSFNTSNLTTASQMLYYCSKLTEVPLLDFGKVIYIADTFYRCTALTDMGGLKDLGKAYLPTESANKTAYTLNLSASTNLTEQSLINVLNNLYDIASIGVKTQQCVLGSTNIAKLTSVEGQQALSNAQAKGWTIS